MTRYCGPLDHIGRIEAPAQADLNDRGIGRMLRKEQESDCGEDLENGDLLAPVGVGHPGQRVGEHVVGNQLAATRRTEAIALMPVDQMRGRVDMDRTGPRPPAAPSKRPPTIPCHWCRQCGSPVEAGLAGCRGDPAGA